MLKIPLLGVLLYGVAEASTAYLITKITDPPPRPAYAEGFVEGQIAWKNKHEFLKLPLDALDVHNEQQAMQRPDESEYGEKKSSSRETFS